MSSSASMDSDRSDQYSIYVGTWINWSRGQIMGSTLTLTRRDADLLIAFTAVLISFVATRVWKIICFFLHRAYSKSTPQDVVYHQQQAILRNSSSPENALYLLLKLLWSGNFAKRRLRPVLTILVATLCVSTFTVAGGFSSQISTAVGSEVLLKGTNCGYINSSYMFEDLDMTFTAKAYRAEKSNNAANYAQQCYSTDAAAGYLDCNRFITKKLPMENDLNASCPFDKSICRNGSANLRLDTGYIDTHAHLGINLPTDRRVQWRHVTHCAPLVTERYTTQAVMSDGNFTLYHYGNVTQPDGVKDFIYRAKSIKEQYASMMSTDDLVSYADYRVENDADLSLIFLSGNGVIYVEPSTDEWYRVSKTPTSISYAEATNADSFPAYLPSEPASVMGCVDQYQFCRPDAKGGRQCGSLASIRDAIMSAAPFFETSFDNIVDRVFETELGTLFQYFLNPVINTDYVIVGALEQLGSKGLTSYRKLYNGYQGPLAPDQWKYDVMNLFNISMASAQALYVNTAFGPTDPTVLRLYADYDTPYSQKICNSQKIRSTAYGSFSLFGLFFTLVLGLLLTLISYLLEPIYSILYKKKGYNKYSYVEWTTNGTLQLQRLAHEEIGMGTWSNCLDSIPVTKAGELLGSLDLADPKHPALSSAHEDAHRESHGSDVTQDSNDTLDEVQGSDDTADQAHEPVETPQQVPDPNEAHTLGASNEIIESETGGNALPSTRDHILDEDAINAGDGVVSENITPIQIPTASSQVSDNNPLNNEK
ncbi:uncharacterized protein GGS22DRAFT_197728 [Annulohypoxylon maeteangense]|uniref:uncharacterized protein n=1 Tax=Annulohypoxylon maeteangense TaxID=1927788 RepID=UPI002007D130|nr:uncharacterized protein GGS22DRAFT_197728 [Annulohypoxylon maeteangense]KAI0887777.1 hypothetical protein GGS22DRAFT_197728 [Annulohypoxylon maeteangense]